MASSLTNGQFEKQLIKTLTRDVNLSNDTKQNLERLQVKSNPYQAELLDRWSRVTFPRFTCETILQLNILHQRHIKETNKLREQQRKGGRMSSLMQTTMMVILEGKKDPLTKNSQGSTLRI